MNFHEEVSKIESEDYLGDYPVRQRPPEKKVNHTTDVGKIVYDIYGQKAPSLIFSHCNNFLSAMSKGGFQWWLIESKLKESLLWCRDNNVNHAGLRTTLKTKARKCGLTEELIKEIK